MTRPISVSLDKILGEKIPVLDHGFCMPLDYCGSDEKIIQAARQSYGSGKKVRNTRGLIRYLVRHGHMSPLEQCSITFLLKVPIFVARQIVRHRTAKLSELSGRYSDLPPEFYVPDPQDLHGQHEVRRQGRDESKPLEPQQAHEVVRDLRVNGLAAFDSYQQHQQGGLAREVARTGLPLSTYTAFYWTIDLRNLLHFLELRLDDHAQLETRRYAEAMADIVEQWVPETWRAFLDYRLNRMVLSNPETEALKRALAFTEVERLFLPRDLKCWSKGEQQEFLDKLDTLGVAVGYQYDFADLEDIRVEIKAEQDNHKFVIPDAIPEETVEESNPPVTCRSCGKILHWYEPVEHDMQLCRGCRLCPVCGAEAFDSWWVERKQGDGYLINCYGCNEQGHFVNRVDLLHPDSPYHKPYKKTRSGVVGEMSAEHKDKFWLYQRDTDKAATAEVLSCRICGEALSDSAIDQEESASGLCSACLKCPKCGGDDIRIIAWRESFGSIFGITCRCLNCGELPERTRADLIMSAKKWIAIRKAEQKAAEQAATQAAEQAESQRKANLEDRYGVDAGVLDKVAESHKPHFTTQALQTILTKARLWAKANKKEVEVYKTLCDFMEESE